MRSGFTLIELLVIMTIISILAGVMMPVAWNVWEKQEVQTTKERMNILKVAMVGDRGQVQNGIRTSYGYVGDYGELPVQGQLTTATLKPFIPGGVTADTYSDAWGRRLRYSAIDNQPGYEGRFLSGGICSDGLDGITGTADDICLEIPVSEVAPTYRIQGNFVFSRMSSAYSSAMLELTFKNPNEATGESTAQPSGCKSKSTAAFPNFTTIFRSSAAPLNLPIGKTTMRVRAFKNQNCTGAESVSGSMDYFISDNISRLLVNLPAVP